MKMKQLDFCRRLWENLDINKNSKNTHHCNKNDLQRKKRYETFITFTLAISGEKTYPQIYSYVTEVSKTTKQTKQKTEYKEFKAAKTHQILKQEILPERKRKHLY